MPHCATFPPSSAAAPNQFPISVGRQAESTMKNHFLPLLSLCALTMTFTPTFAEAPKKLRGLIIDGQNNHDWKTTTPLLKKALESSGRFTVDVATTPAEGQDINSFQPKFSEYDVIVS